MSGQMVFQGAKIVKFGSEEAKVQPCNRRKIFNLQREVHGKTREATNENRVGGRFTHAQTFVVGNLYSIIW